MLLVAVGAHGSIASSLAISGSSSSAEAINEAITRHRLDAVKKLLATTNRPIKVISESCGYTDLAYLKTLFKRRFGCTMRDWRRQNHL